MILLFKKIYMLDQLKECPKFLQDLVYEFAILSSDTYLVNPIITRVSDPFEGESGVHPAKRAVDFADRGRYSKDAIDGLLKHFNEKYKRKDGKPTLLYHVVEGSVLHFHLQVAASMEMYENSTGEEMKGNENHE